MKLFLKDIALTFLATCFFLGLVELVIDYYPNEYNRKYNQWYNNRDSITLLLIGASHVQTNINASVLGPNACNMAIGGSDIYYAQQMMEEYVPQMNSLKAVVFAFGYKSILADTVMEVRKTGWGDLMGFIHNRYFHLNRNELHYKYAILCNQFHYSFFNNKYLTDLELNELDSAFFEDPDFKMHQISEKDFTNEIESLCVMCKIAQDNHVRFIVITAPAHPVFCEQTDSKSMEIMNHAMDSISRIYPMEYKNYLMDSSYWNNDLFLDLHHFNRRGATLFANSIKKDFNLE